MNGSIKKVLFGKARDFQDEKVYHHLSLVAFLAWVGLGADGLSSSCYGPEEAFRALGNHYYLGIFVALASGITIFIISSSYMQIIKLFPAGGGGYLVASKLLSPSLGMVSGCALLIDYILTISISIASGADAIFSFIPQQYHNLKLWFAFAGVAVLLILNLHGVKEAVLPLVPVFLLFIITHLFVILYAVITHLFDINSVYVNASSEITNSYSELGLNGLFFLIMKAYSMGAGTFTGIEAVSNGLPILREPKVKTANKTMIYMAVSLAITVFGLMLAYLLFQVNPQHGKTLNAVLFEAVTQSWGTFYSKFFVLLILFSEAVLLFIAAQAGFLDGPRVLANMSNDRWFPTRFSNLSDRLVTQNGILLMGIAALFTMVLTGGSVKFLVVLYSINVFLTFCLSQLGMVIHWWTERKVEKGWIKKFGINGVGFILTLFILISVIVLKFGEGGWITLIITGTFIIVAVQIKKHYKSAIKMLNRLELIVDSVEASIYNISNGRKNDFNPNAKTAVILVNGFNGLGLHTLLNVIKLFGNIYSNFVFVSVGTIDAGNFKGIAEIQNMKNYLENEINKYVTYMKSNGFHSEAFVSISTDILDELRKLKSQVLEKYPNSVFFGGQLVFPKETWLTRLLHNYVVFAIQKKFYQDGVPFIILPVRI